MITAPPPKAINTPRRARLVTAGLFGMMLAAAYIGSREAPPATLDEVIRPAGWRLGYAPPRGWVQQGEMLAPHDGRSHTYASEDDRRRLAIARIPAAEGDTAEALCREVLAPDLALFAMLSPEAARDIRIRDTQVGNWPGVTLEWTPQLLGKAIGDHIYVLGAIAPSAAPEDPRHAYVVLFKTPAPVSGKDERFWAMFVEALQTVEEQP